MQPSCSNNMKMGARMAAPQPMGEKPQLMGRQLCAASSKQAESRAPGSNSSATWACVGSHSVQGP